MNPADLLVEIHKVLGIHKFPSPSPVLLEAYDPAGRLVYSEKLEGLGPGSHRLTIALKPGVYILRARAEKGSGEAKAIVVK